MPADYTEGFAVREASWHALETLLQDYPTLGDLYSGDPSRDPFILAGHDFDLDEVELYMKRERHIEGVGDTQTFPKLQGFRAIANSKTGTVFQVARDSWTSIANTVGWDLAVLFCDSDPNVRVATAATLGGGSTCFLLLELDEPFIIPGDTSTTLPYVNVHWNHDGTGALKGFRTAIRTVCRNTLDLGFAVARSDNVSFTIRHTKNADLKVEEVKAALSGLRSATEAYKAEMSELARLGVDSTTRERFVRALVPQPVGDVVSDRVQANIDRDRDKVRALFHGPTLPLGGGNAYELVQAGVEYLDWLRPHKTPETLFGRQLLRTDSMKAKLIPMVRELVSA